MNKFIKNTKMTIGVLAVLIIIGSVLNYQNNNKLIENRLKTNSIELTSVDYGKIRKDAAEYFESLSHSSKKYKEINGITLRCTDKSSMFSGIATILCKPSREVEKKYRKYRETVKEISLVYTIEDKQVLEYGGSDLDYYLDKLGRLSKPKILTKKEIADKEDVKRIKRIKDSCKLSLLNQLESLRYGYDMEMAGFNYVSVDKLWESEKKIMFRNKGELTVNNAFNAKRKMFGFCTYFKDTDTLSIEIKDRM